MRKITLLLLLFGCVLLYFLIQKVGIDSLWSSAKVIGLNSLYLIPLSLIWIIPNTYGFAFAMDKNEKKISFRKLMVTRLVGESVNYLTPSGYLGGEALKAALLSKSMGVSGASSSVFIAKTSQTLALLIFIVVGLLFAKLMLVLPHEVKIAATGSLILLSLGVLAMVFVSRGKYLSPIVRWINQRFSKFGFVSKLNDFIHKIDHYFSNYFKNNKKRFTYSFLMHFMGWALGTIEVMFIIFILGYSISLMNAFILSSIATLFMVGGFFIPGSLGAFEIGHYLAASMVGLPPEVGVSVSLARRFREIVWLGMGLVLFALFYKKFVQKK